jgi:plasmid maintenance system killer protein
LLSDLAQNIDDMRAPPGNRLEALNGAWLANGACV